MRVLMLEPSADPAHVQRELVQRGLRSTLVNGEQQRALLVEGPGDLGELVGVGELLAPASPHPMVDAHPRVVEVAGARFGGEEPVLIAGPCAVEDEDTLERCAARVRAAGGKLLRGGAHKPRSSPYSFRGLGTEGLALLRRVADRHGLGVVTELLDPRHASEVGAVAEVVQLGSHSMSNRALHEAAASTGRPVLLKRGPAASVQQWLLAAESVLQSGAPAVILCERGIQSFERATRYTLDLAGVAWLLAHQPLPVVVDPSHAAGRHELVLPLARAALAAGAHGLLVEVHPERGRARCDGPQALDPEDLAGLAALY